MKQQQENSPQNPYYHTQMARDQLEALIGDLRDGVTTVEDLQAQALFETAAEVLEGLQRAFIHYEGKREEAWEE